MNTSDNTCFCKKDFSTLRFIISASAMRLQRLPVLKTAKTAQYLVRNRKCMDIFIVSEMNNYYNQYCCLSITLALH